MFIPTTPARRRVRTRLEAAARREEVVVDEVDLTIDRVHRANGPGESGHDLAVLVPVVEALRHGGLTYLLDHFRVTAIDRAADAGRRLGADDLSRMLDSAAEIARTHRGFGLDRATIEFDQRHDAAWLHRALRETVAGRRQVGPAGRPA